jgi:transcription elongation factor Elf1
MDQRPDMSWTCPDCQSRNATSIARDAEAGRIVDVRCRACGAEHEASVFFALTQAGAPMTVGVVWV